MNLHILFCPSNVDGPEQSSAIPLLSLTLDEEVQVRCAGVVQAEIERLADELHGNDGSGSHHTSDEDEDTGLSGSEDAEMTKSKRSKTKKSGDQSNSRTVFRFNADSVLFTCYHFKASKTTRSQLEREYAFMGTISTFLRAIRAGAIHVRHSAVLLVHYGRLSPAFDLCCKVIVEVLREEGMYKDQGATVVAVATQALREVRRIVPNVYCHQHV